jgi:chromosomal replication initiation ATPase DnaA
VQVDPRLRFDNFVVGSGNRLAVAAARAVADSPGAVYSPLFIYSGSGMGKTHLMCAIGNQITQRIPGAVVEHVTLDDVLGQLHAAIETGQGDAVRQRFEGATAMLIEDIQFLSGRTETQSELLRVLNTLQGTGRQIVMTSDRPPADLPDVDERLLTRLSGGLIVDVGAPDYETRSAILRAKCEERGVQFRPGVIEELSRLEFANVRELQGALNRLIAVQTLGGDSVAPADVLAVLGDLAEARALVARPSGPGEFQAFLSDITTALTEQVDRWQPPLPGPSAAFTRAGFDVGPSNQLAVRAADAVVERPGERYNPLFIHGPSGVGKTHLMNAVGNGLLGARANGRVALVPAQTFVDELIGSLREGSVDRWRATYREVDALLIDDVQFMARKERTQEELFHVFNTLHAAGKQIVFVSDRPPRELSELEERLRSRFEGGLVVELKAPDRDLRAKLFERYLRAAGVTAHADLVAYLAEREVANVREVIGTVNHLVAAAESAGVAVTARFAREELDPTGVGAAPAVAADMPAFAAHDVVDAFFLDTEKVVWGCDDAADRLIEDPR